MSASAACASPKCTRAIVKLSPVLLARHSNTCRRDLKSSGQRLTVAAAQFTADCSRHHSVNGTQLLALLSRGQHETHRQLSQPEEPGMPRAPMGNVMLLQAVDLPTVALHCLMPNQDEPDAGPGGIEGEPPRPRVPWRRQSVQLRVASRSRRLPAAQEHSSHPAVQPHHPVALPPRKASPRPSG
jgi:hypothetical protein